MPVIGEYPCCRGDLWLGEPPEAGWRPGYMPENCPHCGAKVWHFMSRFDPKTYLEADFLALYDVDEAARTIAPKAAPPSTTAP